MLKTAARTLWRNPGFSVTALGMLSLGIGTVSALFFVVDKLLVEPLPYPDPDRLGAIDDHISNRPAELTLHSEVRLFARRHDLIRVDGGL